MLFTCISMLIAGRYANMDAGCSMHNMLCMCTNSYTSLEGRQQLHAVFSPSRLWVEPTDWPHQNYYSPSISHIKGKSILGTEGLLDRHALCTCIYYARENTEP